MPTLMLQLVGPMQSWGTSSRWDDRDTGPEPSWSGVEGLLAAALGIKKEDSSGLDPIRKLRMGVRRDRPGTPAVDFQTAGSDGGILRSNGVVAHELVVSRRHHLMDAAFLVGLEGSDKMFLSRLYAALKNPAHFLSLGRTSYLPSRPIWIKDGLVEADLVSSLSSWPWLGKPRQRECLPDQLLLSMDSRDNSGIWRQDVLLSSFSERRFGGRFVTTVPIPFPGVKS
jgi:CRISPR system Cascade subunit CasD